MELLQIQNLTFAYPGQPKNALEDITFSVQAGEFAVLCGPSGCGKSTLLRLLKRELAPYGRHAGEVLYKGTALDALDARVAVAEIGFVQQDPEGGIVTDTVWHELAFGLESLGLPQAQIRRRVAEMAAYFGIEGWFRKKTTALSGGQKQLLNLASVMVMQPKLLLLDEPTAQLDPIAAANFIATLQKLNRELGLTVLLVEHRLEEVFPIADKVYLLDRGRLEFAETPQKYGAYFKTHPAHPMQAALPAAMRLHTLLEASGDSPLTVRQGRQFITGQYSNRTDTLSPPAYTHSPTPALELQGVWFRYGRDLPDVLRGTDLTIYTGEHFCILGGNGSGKTTVLSVLAGLLQPYRGKVLLQGKKSTAYIPAALYKNNLAVLPQNPQTVFLEKTVRLDLLEMCRAMGYSKEETASAIDEMAEKLQLTRLLDSHPYDLSGGEQQKAALAKILLSRPKILLLDEPTKGIDAYAKRTLAAILQNLKAEGVTVVTVTHDVEFAAFCADRCGMFFDGELVAADTPNAFFSENHFYTTAAHRISRGYYKNAVLCEDVAALCLQNGIKAGAGCD